METESGPAYPNLSLARHRRIAGLPAGQDPEAKRAYGRAVHEAIRALQRRELFGPARLGFRPQCASGTFLNADIGKAIRAQQAAKLAPGRRG